MKANKPDKNNIGNAGEYFIAAVLSANGFITTITLGRAEKYDLIAISPGKTTVKIQVKTNFSNSSSWMLSEKNEIAEKDLYYALVTLNENNNYFEYWMIPSELVAKYVSESHKLWGMESGKNGQKRKIETSMRKFSLKKEKYSPEWFKDEEFKKYHNSIEILTSNFENDSTN